MRGGWGAGGRPHIYIYIYILLFFYKLSNCFSSSDLLLLALGREPSRSLLEKDFSGFPNWIVIAIGIDEDPNFACPKFSDGLPS